jgi:hypothetical protein
MVERTVLSIIKWFTVTYIINFLKIQYKYPYPSFPFHSYNSTTGNILSVYAGIGRLYYAIDVITFPFFYLIRHNRTQKFDTTEY